MTSVPPETPEQREAPSYRKVKILSDRVANQIAAGEVVERPASVVKELIENAIDANATEITLLIANGGKTSITIIDNGSGMSREDAMLAIERFGTSKVRDISDLDEICSLGFRGEALPSIASVSRFSLQTSQRSTHTTEDTGTEIFIEGGKLRNVKATSRNPGTTIEIKNLFFNVPARKKFLRTEITEKGLIKSTLIDLALTRPEVLFRFVSDGVEELALAPVADIFARATDLKLAPKGSLKLTSSTGTMLAMLSPPAESIPSSAKLRLIVNGRAIRDNLLLKAVREGYGNFLKSGAYPSGFICLQLPAQDLDVNVHPRKLEVKFRKSDEVFALVSQTIRQMFVQINPVNLTREDSPHWESPVKYASFTNLPFENSHSQKISSPSFVNSGATTNKTSNSKFAFTQPPILSDINISDTSKVEQFSTLCNARFLGQIFDCYLILEAQNELFIVDMHAAHERIMFYNIRSEILSGNSLPTQLLLTPQVVEIDEDKLEGLERSLPALQRLGIACERFGPNALIVRGLPAMFNRLSPEALFAELTNLPYWDNWEAALVNRIDEVIASLACHSAIRSGRILKKEEVYELLSNMQEIECSGLCPHGRPVLVRISKYELETMFAR